jgi:hypothetical protein
VCVCVCLYVRVCDANVDIAGVRSQLAANRYLFDNQFTGMMAGVFEGLSGLQQLFVVLWLCRKR